MKKLIQPASLKAGDKVAAVSLSWGGAGDKEILWRYQQGKRQLEETFGLKVIEMPHTLKGTEYVYNHPEDRAADLMAAFRDPSIKGIITCIGGIDSLRMTPFIDYEVIRNNPKVFIGYSDTTTAHLICFKAGISSVYGPTLLVDYAENNGMDSYTIEHMKRSLFRKEPLGKIQPAKMWTSEYLPWLIENRSTSRKMIKNNGYECIQGNGKVTGRLLGGCIEVFDTHRGTALFPELEDFDGAILFFETSEDKPDPWYIECVLRTYGMMGLLQRINGMIWGKPMDEKFYKAYNDTIKKVLAEFKLEALPVIVNVNFGHTEPKICLPYGMMLEMDCDDVGIVGL